jgi:cellulase
MKSTFGLLALAAAAKLVNAHATVHAVWINDVDQGAGNSASGYIRTPPNNSPITDVTSPDLTCNVNGKNPVAKTLSVKAGDKVTFEWHHDTRSASDDIIANSHRGPVLTYIAPTEKGTAGSGWVKIAEEGYSNGKWAVDNLIANRGKHSITVPDIPAGEYLLRPEIIALHEGNRQGGAQLYMECVQIKVTSSGTKALPAGVSIPGVYKATDPGILFDIYNSFTSYPIPGPAVWDGSSSGSSASSGSAPDTNQAAAKPVPTTLATVAKPAATPAPAGGSSSGSSPAPAPGSGSSDTGSSGSSPAPAPGSGSSNTGSSGSSPAPAPGAGSSGSGSSGSTSSGSGSAGGALKIFQQCGGQNFSGGGSCESGLVCKQWNPYYHQCVSA